MIEAILAIALHIGGDSHAIPNVPNGGAVYCGAGTDPSPDSNGNTACIAAGGEGAVAPSFAVPNTTTVLPLTTIGYGGFGSFGYRGWGGHHWHPPVKTPTP
jgi:hypothetical protein